MGMENSGIPLNLIGQLKFFLKGISYNNLRCLYIASRDSFGAKDFHLRCDGKEGLVVIIKANGYYFGGYTSSSFKSLNDQKKGWIESEKSFIFSLSNPQNNPAIFKCLYGIYDDPSFGPCFVGFSFLDSQKQTKIYIYDNSNKTDKNFANIGKQNFIYQLFFGGLLIFQKKRRRK